MPLTHQNNGSVHAPTINLPGCFQGGPLLFYGPLDRVGIRNYRVPQMSKAQLPPIFLDRKGRHLHSLMVIPFTRCITLLHPARNSP